MILARIGGMFTRLNPVLSFLNLMRKTLKNVTDKIDVYL